MTNEEKLNQIMGNVELFFSMIGLQKKDSISGYEITTNYLYDELQLRGIERGTDIRLKEKIIKLREECAMFPLVLEDWVKEADFSNKWKEMSEEEKNYILLFSKESYKIIRKSLSAENVCVVDWRIIQKEDVAFQLNEKLIQKWKLPKELLNPPKTKQEINNWKETMLDHGYDTSVIIFDDKIAKKNYAYIMISIMCQYTDKKILTQDLYETNAVLYLKNKEDFCIKNEQHFFIQNELEYKKIKFKDDLKKELDQKPTDTIKKNKI